MNRTPSAPPRRLVRVSTPSETRNGSNFETNSPKSEAIETKPHSLLGNQPIGVRRGVVAGRPVHRFGTPPSNPRPVAKALGPEDADGAKKQSIIEKTGTPEKTAHTTAPPTSGRRSSGLTREVSSKKCFVFFVQTNPEQIEGGLSSLLSPGSNFEMIVVDENRVTLSKATWDNETEAYKSLVEAVNNPVNEAAQAQLITYEGRIHVIPRLNLVAMKNSFPLGVIARTGDRYSSFTTRFSQQYHYDVADVVSNFGAVSTPSLEDLFKFIIGDEENEAVDKLAAIFWKMQDR